MKILIAANSDSGLFQFRKELITYLLNLKHEIYVSAPKGEYVDFFTDLGCIYHQYEFDRHGTNPLKEFKHIKYYKNLLKEIKPDVVLTYTVKPNIYCGTACASLGIPYIANITGLGIAIENGGLLQKITSFLYRYGLRKARKIFFQNEGNLKFMLDHKVAKVNYGLIPGSGVNIDRFSFCEYPEYPQFNDTFLFIGRVMKDKGIDELLSAAERIKKDYPDIEFDIVGGYDDDIYSEIINRMNAKNIIKYFGSQPNVIPFIEKCNALVLPSYHEGMANVLLEASAVGRPVLASNIHGCKEAFDESVTGFGFEPKNVDSLYEALKRFILLSRDEKAEMGRKAREKMEKEFDRQIVIDAYLEEINKIKEV